MSEPRFLPPKGKSEHHMASTDGHSCVIYLKDPDDEKKGTIIPERFRRQAIADNCGVVGIDDAEGDGAGLPTKADLIIAAIAAVLERQVPEELEGDGRPKLAVVGKQAGFKVTKAQFDDAWPKYVDGLGKDDEDSDD